MTAEASGTVAAILVTEGDAVTKGQTLMTLGGDYETTLQNAADSLRSSEISVANAEGSLKSAALAVSDSQGNVRNAELSVENARLSLENARDKLGDYTITSPISGTIVEKFYKTGDTVESGKQLCTIYDLSYLEMTLSIDELDISTVSVGQSVGITAGAVEGKQYQGVVTRVSVAGTTTNGTTVYPVTIRLDETDGLLPGMNVDAEIIVREAAGTLSIPNAAVNRGGLVLVTRDSPSAANAAELPAASEDYVYVRVETGISDDDYENVEVPLMYAGVRREERRRRATEALVQVGLGDRLRHKPSELSGGQQQRVSIARALVGHPAVILADEPTGALDSHTSREVLNILQELHEQGNTIVLITHDNAIAVQAERIIRLEDGRVVYDGDAHAPEAVVRSGWAGGMP